MEPYPFPIKIRGKSGGTRAALKRPGGGTRGSSESLGKLSKCSRGSSDLRPGPCVKILLLWLLDVDTVDILDTVDTVDIVDTVDTVDTLDAVDTIDTLDTIETVDTVDT